MLQERHRNGDRIRPQQRDPGLHHIKPRGPITVTIDPIVAEYFRDDQTVNDALRGLIVEGSAPKRVE